MNPKLLAQMMDVHHPLFLTRFLGTFTTTLAVLARPNRQRFGIIITLSNVVNLLATQSVVVSVEDSTGGNNVQRMTILQSDTSGGTGGISVFYTPIFHNVITLGQMVQNTWRYESGVGGVEIQVSEIIYSPNTPPYDIWTP